MSGKITNDVLESRLKCRYKSHLKTAREQGFPHDYEILMKESRERVRRVATARLLARHRGDEVSSGMPLTADLLKRGLPLLLDATFEDEKLSVRFDAVLRVDGDSPLGGFHYQPVIFHEAGKATADLRMLLALLGVILCGIQGKEPATGVLIYGRGCQEKMARLAGVVVEARRLLREICEAGAGPLPRLVLPPLPGMRVSPAVSGRGNNQG